MKEERKDSTCGTLRCKSTAKTCRAKERAPSVLLGLFELAPVILAPQCVESYGVCEV